MAPYSGGGQRSQGWGYVREPAEGFFIGGSSVKDMNGVYKRVNTLPGDMLSNSRGSEAFQLVYRKWPADAHDDMTGWHMALVSAPEGVVLPGGKRSEWLFIDPTRRDRFAHEGDTIIPGCCDRWKHLHRSPPNQESSPQSESTAVTKAQVDDEDELPWQVIFIGDASMVENLRNHHRYHEYTQHRARLGAGLPPVADCRDLGPDGCRDDAPPQLPTPAEGGGGVPAAHGEADAAYAAGEFAAAAKLYAAAAAAGCGGCATAGERLWYVATMHRNKAGSLRRERDFAAALDAAAAALALFPRYKAALRERALTLLDAGRPEPALTTLEQLLRVDRADPDITNLLVLARARIHRATEAREAAAAPGGAGPQGYLAGTGSDSDRAVNEAVGRAGLHVQHDLLPGTDYYTLLGLALDFSPEELKQAYKKMSKLYHPDRPGGSAAAFQRVAAAYETLGDPVRRREYDLGGDVRRPVQQDGSEGPPLSEQVERHYFPDHFDFLPFGDPFQRKRDLHDRRRREAPPQPNGPGLPEGSYLGSCRGCALTDGGRTLRCSHCDDGRGGSAASSLAAAGCGPGEQVGNRFGALACEPAPQAEGGPAQADSADTEEEVPAHIPTEPPQDGGDGGVGGGAEAPAGGEDGGRGAGDAAEEVDDSDGGHGQPRTEL